MIILQTLKIFSSYERIWLNVILLMYMIMAIQGKKQLHEYMTKEEIESVFNVKHDDIHKIEYEVVPVHHKHDSQKNVKLRTFNRNYDLYLERNNHILIGRKTPVYLAKSNPSIGCFAGDPISYTRRSFPLPDYFELYHDMQNRAALSAHMDTDNNILLNGMIGDNLIVRSVPTRVHQEVLNEYPTFARDTSFQNHFQVFSNNSFSSEAPSGKEYQTTQHIIIKSPITDTEDINGDIVTDLLFERVHDKINKKKQQRLSKKGDNNEVDNRLINLLTNRRSNEPYPPGSKRSVKPSISADSSNLPDTVYPELLVTVDYETFRIHGSSVENVAKYMAAFWNAVDLRYREMNNPKVRLNIAGLIIPQDSNSTPYFEFKHGDSQTISASETIHAIGDYFLAENYFPKNTYDIIVGLTSLDLEDIEKGEQSGDLINGLAKFQSACLVHLGWSIALGYDKGSFNGIIPVAHELAHVMGAPHDGDQTGGPCPWNNGYLMSTHRQTAKGLHWSSCSIAAMRNFLRSEKAECLRNKPNPGKPLPKTLPGKILSRNEQCQRVIGRNADPTYANDCALLWCDGDHESKPPAEGTSCGNEMICLDAQCVRDPELEY